MVGKAISRKSEGESLKSEESKEVLISVCGKIVVLFRFGDFFHVK